MNEIPIAPYLLFKLHFHVIILDQERVALVSEDTHHMLKGFVYVSIANLISYKELTEEEIARNLINKYSQKEIEFAIAKLKKKGFLVFFLLEFFLLKLRHFGMIKDFSIPNLTT